MHLYIPFWLEYLTVILIKQGLGQKITWYSQTKINHLHVKLILLQDILFRDYKTLTLILLFSLYGT